MRDVYLVETRKLVKKCNSWIVRSEKCELRSGNWEIRKEWNREYSNQRSGKSWWHTRLLKNRVLASLVSLPLVDFSCIVGVVGSLSAVFFFIWLVFGTCYVCFMKNRVWVWAVVLSSSLFNFFHPMCFSGFVSPFSRSPPGSHPAFLLKTLQFCWVLRTSLYLSIRVKSVPYGTMR